LVDSLGVIDGHVHVGGAPERHGSPDEILRLLESIGADRAVCLPAPGIEPDNSELERLLAGYEGRLFPSVWVNPLAGPRAVQTVRRYAKQGWQALKLQPTMHQFSLSATPTLAVVEAALAHRMVIIIHTGGSSFASPWAVGHLARRYPEARIIVDHMGGNDVGFVEAAITVAEENPNLYLGTSQMPFYRKYQEAASRIGPSRIIFGSDAPMVHPKPEFERIRAAELPPTAEADIFGGNLARLLGL